MRSSTCKIVYIVCNLRDVFVSHCKFLNKLEVDGSSFLNEYLSKEALFDGFCYGFFCGGPFVERKIRIG